MERDYIGNLKVLAAINRNSVSEQNLKLLGVKYSLSDAEMHELYQYCKDNGIEVYDEEIIASVSDDSMAAHPVRKAEFLTEEEREYHRQVSIIAKQIMHIASVRARKRVNGRGWLCGTYTSSVRKAVESQVRRCFSQDELEFIINHLSDPDETGFTLQDREKQEICEDLNDRLNELIPQLHINRFYSDLFDE